MIFPEALKQILYKLKKQDLIELLDSFFWNVEEYQEERRQHLVDRLKIIANLEKENARQERTIDWQRDRIRQKTKEILELEYRLKTATGKEATKH